MSYWGIDQPFSVLIGKTLVSVTRSDDEITFECSDGYEYKMYHSQSCCESVSIEDICGDLADLSNALVTNAEEVSGETAQPADWKPDEYSDSYTWTFYKLDTNKGGVTIRWYGSSNGYYSESVDFEQIKPSRETA